MTDDRLTSARADVTRNGCEIVPRAADNISTFYCSLKELRGLLASRSWARNRRPCQLSLRQVFPCGLSEGLRGFFLIQKVIHNLEGQADGASKAVEMQLLVDACSRQDSSKKDRRGDELAGLVLMDELNLLQQLIGGRAVGSQSFRGNVGDLPSDHPPRIDRLSDHPRRPELGSRVQTRDRFGQPGEGLGQQRIAHQ